MRVRVATLILVYQSENFLEARFSSVGKTERCCENKPRQDPQT
jgi:hypothetical protein